MLLFAEHPVFSIPLLAVLKKCIENVGKVLRKNWKSVGEGVEIVLRGEKAPRQWYESVEIDKKQKFDWVYK